MHQKYNNTLIINTLKIVNKSLTTHLLPFGTQLELNQTSEAIPVKKNRIPNYREERKKCLTPKRRKKIE